jgi:hypothetical protein
MRLHVPSVAALAAILSLLSAPATAGEHAYDDAASGRPGFYGAPAPSTAASRVLPLHASTRWLNVTQNETVRIQRGDRFFDWTFSTWTTHSFDLARIAPAGFVAPATVQVYVAPDPRYER